MGLDGGEGGGLPYAYVYFPSHILPSNIFNMLTFWAEVQKRTCSYLVKNVLSHLRNLPRCQLKKNPPGWRVISEVCVGGGEEGGEIVKKW